MLLPGFWYLLYFYLIYIYFFIYFIIISVLQFCRKPQSFRELSCFHILQDIMGICSTYCRFNGIPSNCLQRMLFMDYYTLTVILNPNVLLRAKMAQKKKCLCDSIFQMLCVKSRPNMYQKSISLQITSVHKTAATDLFMNWTDLEFCRPVIWMVFMIF